MKKTTQPVMIEIDKLRPSRLHTDIFKCFERKYKQLNKRISMEGFNQNCHLLVREIKGGYEVICGVGRYNYLSAFNKNAGKSESSILVPCIINNSDDDELLILILRDNFFGCRSITGFTEFQYYLLGWLLNAIQPSVLTDKMFEEQFLSEINIKHTLYSFLNPTITRILRLLAEKNEIELDFNSADLSKRQVIYLINKSIEDSTDTDFTLFFKGKISINSAYQHYSGKKINVREVSPNPAEDTEARDIKTLEENNSTQIVQSIDDASATDKITEDISPTVSTEKTLKAEMLSAILVFKKVLNVIEAEKTFELDFIPNTDKKIVQKVSGLINKPRSRRPKQTRLFEETLEN